MPAFEIDTAERERAQQAVYDFCAEFSQMSGAGRKVMVIELTRRLGAEFAEISRVLRESSDGNK